MTRKAYGTCSKCGTPVAHKHRNTCRACFIGRLGASTPLRRWRQRTGKSYRDLADETGISIRTIMRLASGAIPRGEVALKISRATGIPLAELLRGA